MAVRIDIKLGEGLSGTTEWQVEVASRRAEEIGRVANWLCNVGEGRGLLFNHRAVNLLTPRLRNKLFNRTIREGERRAAK